MKFYYFIALFVSSFFINAQTIPLYVGTYTGVNSEGIYYYNFNTLTGEITNKRLAVKTENPSFITFSSDKKYLYAVNENDENSFVKAYEVNTDGTLAFINKVSTNGNGPCHVQLNETNNKLVVSNYGGGTFSIYTINKSGSINEAAQVFDHNLESKKSHAHSAKFYKNNLFVADLGRDFLAQYIFNDKEYALKENHLMKEGAGPRHFEISKNGAFIYVINELNSTVTVLQKKDKNTYLNIQSLSTLNDDFKGTSYCADIHLSADEKFLYGSNRGENSIVVFKRNLKTGTLEKIQNISVNGDWPRNFIVSPDGNFLLVANQRSENISVYKVNKESGQLTYSYKLDTPAPVCLLF